MDGLFFTPEGADICVKVQHIQSAVPCGRPDWHLQYCKRPRG